VTGWITVKATAVSSLPKEGHRGFPAEQLNRLSHELVVVQVKEFSAAFWEIVCLCRLTVIFRRVDLELGDIADGGVPAAFALASCRVMRRTSGDVSCATAAPERSRVAQVTKQTVRMADVFLNIIILLR